METCTEAVQLIKEEESLRLKAYECAAGRCTIGYGHTGPDVRMGQVISAETAERLMTEDLRKFEAGVSRMTAGLALTEGQFGALVAFAFNVGLEALARSRLLAKLKAGDVAGAADELPKWVKARHPKTGELRVLPGLVRRRARERALFLEEAPPQIEVAFATPSPELREFVAIVPPVEAP